MGFEVTATAALETLIGSELMLGTTPLPPSAKSYLRFDYT
ncbi:hypothetical protein Ptr902_11120 [Pyrenophora tritici-repentis]|nr:hypothetical protein Ptr902_11120 [Pyrenophora tritici-repentis]